ncbi:mevalonate kinase family protein [Microbacterium sp. gxy059]|uniref:mevalonate kinase n=1 Tax=uncultured bacterium WT8 TaxID=1393214 RepID=U3Q0T1_9BACT|nr:Wt8.28c [uncultured bacterium WT8]
MLPDTEVTRALPAVGRAHAKSILIGEHSAVYGAPAIAFPVRALAVEARLAPSDAPRLATALFRGPVSEAPRELIPVLTAWQTAERRFGAPDGPSELAIDSAVPPTRGLGSSAAVAVAVVRAAAAAAGAQPGDDLVHALAQEAETVAHGSPSGIDARAVAADGPVLFRGGEAAPLAVGAPFSLVIADTGVAGSTGIAVGSVARLRAEETDAVDARIARLADLAERAAGDLAAGDVAGLGARMGEAHDQLSALGVSSPELDALVDAARAAGSPGAKLTGAGQGGCALALASSSGDALEIAAALRQAGATQTWMTTIGATA